MARAKQEEGHIRLQIKVGGRSVEEDIAVAHKVVETLRPGIEYDGWERLLPDLKTDIPARCSQ